MSSWVQASGRQEEETVAQRRRWFLRRQWLVMAIIGLAIVLIEIVDHSRMHQAHGGAGLLADVELYREILMYGIGLPVIGGLLLSFLSRTLFERERALQVIDRQRTFGEELIDATCWEERAARIARFPVEVASAVQSNLTLFDLDQQGIALATSWPVDDGPLRQTAFKPELETCWHCSAAPDAAGSIRRCPQDEGAYCLPLDRAGSLLGVLTFDLPPGQALDHWYRQTLHDATPAISQAIEVMHLESLLSSSADAVEVERRRIARNLHDTLAQNITYLRLKLDQLSEDASLREIAALQQEIHRMHDVADEAYAQVRQTLLTLRERNQLELLPTIRELAQSVSARTGRDVEVGMNGEPLSLTPVVRHNALNVCREALNNVEKHASGSNASVGLTWYPDRLEIQINDDGPGFDPGTINWDHCYGIGFMYERAQAIGGSLSVHSAAGKGTQVTLSIPVESKETETA